MCVGIKTTVFNVVSCRTYCNVRVIVDCEDQSAVVYFCQNHLPSMANVIKNADAVYNVTESEVV